MKHDNGEKPAFLDHELEAFITCIWRTESRIGDPLIKLDLLRFLSRNPSAIDSAPDLALRVGRNMDRVEAALSDLADCGVVAPRGEVWGAMFYSLSSEADVRALVERFFAVCFNSRESIIALYRWLDINFGAAADNEK